MTLITIKPRLLCSKFYLLCFWAVLKNVTHFAQYYACNYCNYATVYIQFYYFNDYISIVRLQPVVFYISMLQCFYIWHIILMRKLVTQFVTCCHDYYTIKVFYKNYYIKAVISMSTNWLIMTLINYTDHFVVTLLNPTYYASIMLNAFNNLLCWHNRPGPNYNIVATWWSCIQSIRFWRHSFDNASLISLQLCALNYFIFPVDGTSLMYGYVDVFKNLHKFLTH